MKSAVAILTYRRLNALTEEMKGLEQFCSHYPTAIFEDCGQRDATSAAMSHGRVAKARPELMADEMIVTPEGLQAMATPEQKLIGETPKVNQHFLGNCNLGVAGNSNRALKWFMDETDADHLCLLNDDLHVLGDFVGFYRSGHVDLDVGMFCFCPSGGQYDHDSYKWVLVRSRGYAIRLMPRLTGIMISITRKLVEKVGYFDTRFGKFGEEHCDYTYRCRFAGGLKLEGVDQGCLDLEPPTPLLKHQEIETSVSGPERQRANQEAAIAMKAASGRYMYEHYYQPFTLKTPKTVGGFGQHPGINYDAIKSGHALVQDIVPGV
jgi:hypothetical protein